MANIYDVARVAGVSISTVSHVLNGTRYVSDETRERVLTAIKSIGFRPSSLARAMVRQETLTVALIVADNINPFVAELAHGIEDYGFKAGYNVILCNSEHDRTKEKAYMEMLLSKRIDGLIYMPEEIQTEQIEPVLDYNIPIVLFDREFQNFDAVLQDNFQGGYQITQHLIALGHKRIACITGPDLFRSYDRYLGYKQALYEGNIRYDPELVIKGDWSYEKGAEAAERLLKIASPPTSIFACNDVMAIGTISYLHKNKLRVPEELSVAGFDNISLSNYVCPPLTTYAMPILEMGKKMCQILLDRISGKLSDDPQRPMMSGTLLLRDSTARPLSRN